MSTSVLHTLNKPPSHWRFATCIEQLKPNDALLLLEDGVLGQSHPWLMQQLSSGVRVYVLRTDAEARGLRLSTPAALPAEPAAEWCTMAEFVELTETYTRVINW